MLVGYARVSTRDQDRELQLRELRAAGCGRIYEETASGAGADRPQLAAALEYTREGDVLVVWRLDRLGRSLRELIDLVNLLAERGIGLRSLRESWDTTTPGGKLVFHVFGALAEFERDLVRERTRAGLEAARARGRRGGRRPKLDARGLRLASSMLKDHGNSIADVCAALGVSRSTLYRHLRPDGTPRAEGTDGP